MTDLSPCPACLRHVRASDVACPFCGATARPVAPRLLPRGRWSRAAVFAAGATVAACGGKKDEPPAPGSATAGSATPGSATAPAPADAATPVAVDAPPPDAAPVDAGTPDAAVHKHVIHKRPVHDHPMPKPYGAPPARSRIV